MTAGIVGALVVDTHSAVWYLHEDERLSRRAEREIDDALADGHFIHVPSISIVELVYLVEKGRVPAVVAERVDRVLLDPASGLPRWICALRRPPGRFRDMRFRICRIG